MSQDVSTPASVFEGSGSRATRLLGAIEKWGNRLPHPFYLFLILGLLIAVVSAGVAMMGAAAVNPQTGEDVPVRSLISGEGLVYVLTSAIENFVAFPPLGLIITVMLGIGVAERTGLLKVAMRSAVLSAPGWAITFVVVLISLMGNLASDSAIVVLPPLAALAFMAAGRHPLAGFVVSYVSVIAGFSANVIPAGTDVLMAGISTSAAQIVDAEHVVSPVSNWYFMSVSTVVLAIAITLTCRYLVEPRLGEYTGTADTEAGPVTAAEKRGLRSTGLAVLLYLIVVVVAVAIPTSPLRGDNGDILQSPFMSSVPVFILFLFLVAGVTFGFTARTLTSTREIPGMMSDAVKELVPFIVVIFAAAQAIAWFGWTNLGLLLAGGGAQLLEATGLNGIAGLLLFSVLVAIPALILASGSALWTLLAPIAIPMFMLAGIDPAYTQAAFRITDSATNPLVPLSPMLPVILGLMQKYTPKGTQSGLGTLFSLVFPFTMITWGVWLLLLLTWGMFGLPVGPGHELTLP